VIFALPKQKLALPKVRDGLKRLILIKITTLKWIGIQLAGFEIVNVGEDWGMDTQKIRAPTKK
jgi:hypothetical protein